MQQLLFNFEFARQNQQGTGAPSRDANRFIDEIAPKKLHLPVMMNLQ